MNQNLSPIGADGCPLTVEYRPIETLHPDPRNPRVHSKHQIRQIARSIEAFGFNVPILIDDIGTILAGHGRVLACQLLQWTEVPTITVSHLSPEQITAFRIADNRLTENAAWDERLLGEQLKELSLLDLSFSLDATGFEIGEIDFRIENLEAVDDEDARANAMPACGPAVCAPGDLWVLGNHRILCGDALDPSSYGRLLAGKTASMMFADPPYNVRVHGHVGGKGEIQHPEFAMASGEMSVDEFTQFLTTFCTLAAKYTVDGSIHFVCMDWRHLPEVLASGRAVYSELKNVCVWVKDNAGMGSLYRSQHELILVFKNGTAAHVNNVALGAYGRSRSNVWNYPGVNSFARATDEGNLLALHPTVKPVALVADAILDCSRRRQIVLDPFLGSGTTVLAAERTGRFCYGIELDPHYVVDVAIRRWQTLTGHPAILERTGRPFDDPTHPSDPAVAPRPSERTPPRELIYES